MASTASPDTAPAAAQRQIESWRAMNIAEKLLVAADLSRAAEDMARAGIRFQYPNADAVEVEMRLASRRLGHETVLKVFGWEPSGEAV